MLVLRKLHIFLMRSWKAVNLLLMTLLLSFTGKSQPVNDACNSATPLCPNVISNGTNYAATATVCPDCEDDFTFCFSGVNSVWYRFTTNNNGGNVTVDVTNLVFNPQANRGNQLQAVIVNALVPCDAATFTTVSNCESAGSANFQLLAPALLPNTDYYIVINGAKNGAAVLPAEATFEIQASGPGIDRLPVGISIGGNNVICPSNPVAYSAYIDNCTDTSLFQWSLNGVLVSQSITPYFLSSSIQDGDVLSVSCTCFDVCPETVNYVFGAISVDNLVVDAGPDQTINSGTTVVLNATSNGSIYSWTPAILVSSDSTATTYSTPNSTTTYFVTASNNFCSVSDEVTVFVTDHIVVPGSFSPNGDGTNDRWLIEGIEFYPNTQVSIYDRWGQLITDITGYSILKSWDGTNNGKPVTDGVYFYSIDFNDEKREILKGSVSVIR